VAKIARGATVLSLQRDGYRFIPVDVIHGSGMKWRKMLAGFSKSRRINMTAVRASARTQDRPRGVVIADDHAIFRDGLRRLLEDAGLQVLGEARDGVEAVTLVRQLTPDILLLDLSMPKHSGLETLRELSNNSKENSVRVILLTAAAEKAEIVEALHLGARGVVMKASATEVLLTAINTVMAGDCWVGLKRVPNLVQYLQAELRASRDEARAKTYGLTARELQIVSAVVAGLANKEIAAHFKISEDTVKHHLGNIFDKLGVSTRLELALFAVNHNLPLPPIE
jgi:two-component system nitrate/nitrite response regulator NarL